jgi:hypothetical protein
MPTKNYPFQDFDFSSGHFISISSFWERKYRDFGQGCRPGGVGQAVLPDFSRWFVHLNQIPLLFAAAFGEWPCSSTDRMPANKQGSFLNFRSEVPACLMQSGKDSWRGYKTLPAHYKL